MNNRARPLWPLTVFILVTLVPNWGMATVVHAIQRSKNIPESFRFIEDIPDEPAMEINLK